MIRISTQPRTRYDRNTQTNTSEHDPTQVTLVTEWDEEDDDTVDDLVAQGFPRILDPEMIEAHNRSVSENTRVVTGRFVRLGKPNRVKNDNGRGFKRVLMTTYGKRDAAVMSEHMVSRFFGSNTD